MSEINKDNIREKFEKMDFLSQATITFMACVRRIVESDQVPEIKSDASIMASQYYRDAVRIDMIKKIIMIYKEDEEIPMEVLVGVMGSSYLDNIIESERRLKTMMSTLF